MILRISKRSDPFARVDRRILSDPRLSWKAKGILAYLLGHSNDWQVRVTDIIKRSTDGRDAVYSAMKELREIGYAELAQIRKGGKFIGKEWTVSDSPNTGFPDTENPNTENPDTTKNRKKGSAGRKLPPADLTFGLECNGHGPLKLSKVVKLFSKFSIKKGYHERPGGFSKGAQRGGWTRHTLQKWQRDYKWLAQRVDKDKILTNLRWFMDHHNDDFVPTAQTFSTFATKFEAIDQARKRKLKQRGGSDNEKRNPRGYILNGKFVPSEEDDNEKRNPRGYYLNGVFQPSEE